MKASFFVDERTTIMLTSPWNWYEEQSWHLKQKIQIKFLQKRRTNETFREYYQNKRDLCGYLTSTSLISYSFVRFKTRNFTVSRSGTSHTRKKQGEKLELNMGTAWNQEETKQEELPDIRASWRFRASNLLRGKAYFAVSDANSTKSATENNDSITQQNLSGTPFLKSLDPYTAERRTRPGKRGRVRERSESPMPTGSSAPRYRFSPRRPWRWSTTARTTGSGG